MAESPVVPATCPSDGRAMAKWLPPCYVQLPLGSDREIWLRGVATGRAIIVRRDTYGERGVPGAIGRARRSIGTLGGNPNSTEYVASPAICDTQRSAIQVLDHPFPFPRKRQKGRTQRAGKMKPPLAPVEASACEPPT